MRAIASRVREVLCALRGESGQALAEQTLLLATLLGGLAVGGMWLMKAHPEMLNALDAQVRGLYFVLSLPFL